MRIHYSLLMIGSTLWALLGGCASSCPREVGAEPQAEQGALPAPVASDWQGKVVVADFWATWCGPCRASSPNVQILHDQFASDPGVLVVGVNADDRSGDPLAYAAEHGYTYPMVVKGEAVADAFGVNALPTFIVLDSQGREAHRHVGMLTLRAREEIAAKVRELRG